MARVTVMFWIYLATIVLAAEAGRQGRLGHFEDVPRENRPRPRAHARFGALWSIAALAVAPASAQLLPAFREMDTDENSLVDKEEFMLSLRDQFDAAGHGRGSPQRNFMYRLGEKLYETCDLDADEMLNANEVEFCDFVTASELHAIVTRGTAVEPERCELGLARAQEVLEDLDVDGDGWIDRSEWAQAFHGLVAPLGFDRKRLADQEVAEEIERLFSKADGSRDGRLSVREVQFGAFLINGFIVRELASTLFGLDEDGDGAIHESEVLQLVSTVKRPTGKSLAERLLRVFHEADSDGDQCLKRREAEAAAALILIGLELEAVG
eukprot:CAMPEP_0176061598 /NCGR_PEP_ID=MMETSP0120_2-20121206/30711_1 /TAXON_ID=160619 /ORGANISM="Kryptoperidinium foliaceum, Strain CCMP 1326" /LENGTH=323 /DNA_ID=CAMNT_0017395155 /DNA_START=13 /DNA_END=984 /DNA_ORIENTATION=+